MGLEVLRGYLGRHRRVALDASVFIYHLDPNPLYAPATRLVFKWLDAPAHRGISSTLTITELLVHPYRDDDQVLISAIDSFLTTHPHLEWIEPDLTTANLAARFRAAHRMRTPDAILAACAVRARATALITNDAVFRRVPDFETLLLDDVV